MKKQALFCIALAGTLMVGGCGQKATDSTAGTAQVTETSDSAPADKPDGVQDKNSDNAGWGSGKSGWKTGTAGRRKRRSGWTERCSDILYGSLKLLHRY